MVQTSLMFSGGIQSLFQPIGFVFCYVFVRSLAVDFISSYVWLQCFSPGVASSPKMHFCVVFNLCFTTCGLAAQIGNSSSTRPVFHFSLPVQNAWLLRVQALPFPLCCTRVCPANTAHLRLYQYRPGAGVTHAGKCSLIEGVSSTSEKNMQNLGIERILQSQF